MGSIKSIGAEETLPLRSKVLRSGMPFDKCRFPEDSQDGFHLGYFEDGDIIGIASFFYVNDVRFAVGEIQNQLKKNLNIAVELMDFDCIQGKSIQLRGMAVDPQYQGKGLGKAIVQAAERQISTDPEITHICCNARKIAYQFYQSQGFEFVSEEFEIPTIGPHRIMVKKVKSQKEGSI